MIIVHHNKDLDGFSSGAICKLKYPDAKLIGWDYSEPIPDLLQFQSEDLIMIDISFNMDVMNHLGLITKSFVWIDHHVSAYDSFMSEKDAPGLQRIEYIYELGVAACEIGWKHLFPEFPTPPTISLLGRYDTWRQQEGDWEGETLPFQYGMRTICTSAETFPLDSLRGLSAWAFTGNTVSSGKAILKYQEQQDMLACQRSAFEAVVGGKSAICLNTRAFSSNTMKSVYDPSKHDIMVGFEYTGSKWSVSLRSAKQDVDVSVIAKSRGGGGHKAAAGFECDSFEDIFK